MAKCCKLKQQIDTFTEIYWHILTQQWFFLVKGTG